MKLNNQPKVLAATYNPVSKTKMISFLVDFPTVLLAELRTHRILTQGSLYEHSELDNFNLSANSARAIPANKYLDKVANNPFMPIWTGKQSGMSGASVSQEVKDKADKLWKDNLNERRYEVSRVWVNDCSYLIKNSDEKPKKEDYKDLEEYEEDLEEYYNMIKDFDNSSESFKSVTNERTLKSNYEDLIAAGIHKQNANRLLAPFAYTTCIISGTELENFFDLRCPKYELTLPNGEVFGYYQSKKTFLIDYCLIYKTDSDLVIIDDSHWQSINKSGAQPEFQVIAEMLYDLYHLETEWKESKYHIPFKDEILEKYYTNIREHIGTFDFAGSIEEAEQSLEEQIMSYVKYISASMCAKLSYNTQDNEDTFEKHLERANMLIEHSHWEPFSHQAVAMNLSEYESFGKIFPAHLHFKPFNSFREVNCDDGRKLKQHIEYGWCYNNRGFITQRYFLENGRNKL